MTDYKNELDAFGDSDLLLTLIEGLDTNPLAKQFLRNRFAAAFEAGWNARAKYDNPPGPQWWLPQVDANGKCFMCGEDHGSQPCPKMTSTAIVPINIPVSK